jgi:ABC-type amino acid transport substrate-binding protein
MRECLRVVVVWAMVVGVMATGAAAETTLEKINRTGIFMVGTRTASPPFGFINKQNEWVGFSIDLARLVHKNIEKRLKKPIKFERISRDGGLARALQAPHGRRAPGYPLLDLRQAPTSLTEVRGQRV